MGLFDDLIGGGKEFLFGESADRQRKRVRKRFGDAQDALTSGYLGAIEKQGVANRERAASYEGAEKAVSQASRSARRGAKERSNELTGQLEQRYGAGGKYGTTALDNARMGLASSLTRDLTDLDARFSGLLGDIGIQKGEAAGRGQEQIGNLLAQLGGGQANLFTGLAGSEFSPTGNIGEILGAIIGATAGGGGG